MSRRVIAVDFDGTICDHEFPNIGKMKEGVVVALSLFRLIGLYVLVYSCRTAKRDSGDYIFGDMEPMTRPTVIEMREFLDKNGIPYDEIYDGTGGKPIADFYIDDKGLRFADNWPEIAETVFKYYLGAVNGN